MREKDEVQEFSRSAERRVFTHHVFNAGDFDHKRNEKGLKKKG